MNKLFTDILRGSARMLTPWKRTQGKVQLYILRFQNKSYVWPLFTFQSMFYISFWKKWHWDGRGWGWEASKKEGKGPKEGAKTYQGKEGNTNNWSRILSLMTYDYINWLLTVWPMFHSRERRSCCNERSYEDSTPLQWFQVHSLRQSEFDYFIFINIECYQRNVCIKVEFLIHIFGL